MSIALKAVVIVLLCMIAFELGHSRGDSVGFTRGAKAGIEQEHASNVSRETALAQQREDEIHAGIQKGLADAKVQNDTLEHQRDVALSSADYWYARLDDWVREHPGAALPSAPARAQLPASGPHPRAAEATALAPDPSGQRGNLAGDLARCAKSVIASNITLTDLFNESDIWRTRAGVERNMP